MKGYTLALIIAIIVVVTAIILVLISFTKYSLSPAEGCKIIIKNEGIKKINIVFLTNNIQENLINRTIELFLNSTPFSNNKEKFNFYYAGESDCEVQGNQFVFCYSKKAVKKSAVCPNNYIVVLTNQSYEIRSSAYINFISLNINNINNTIIHEFGHVFANLADEYIPSIIPFGSKNCRRNCENFKDIEGCFKGCSESDYSRSSENSVMKSLETSDYRKLNNLLIENNLNKYE